MKWRRITATIVATTLLASLLALPVQMVRADSLVAKQLSSRYNPMALQLKFTEAAQVRLVEGRFVSQTGQNLDELNRLLDDGQATQKQPLITDNPQTLKQRKHQAQAETGEAVADLSTYFRITVSAGRDSQQISQTLKRLPYVVEAYAEPALAAAPVSPDFSSMQRHFSAAPDGLGIQAAASQPGISGSRVTVADVEYSWNTAHEDLSDTRATGARLANGTPGDPFGDTNHGTAVAGVISGDKNGFGVNGIAPDANLRLVNTYSNEYGWNVANAIYLATANLQKGDVIVIEQQAWGPTGNDLVPVEWMPSVYDAIKLATSSGVVVVEAAGNSGVNLSDPIYGSKFPMGKADSGAIMVGAGSYCDTATNRTRLSYSNYGTRLNVQGPGECVVTTGYGSVYWGNDNATYTDWFNGTSSATAVIGGVAAALSSAYEQENGKPIKPSNLRSILSSTGSAQTNTKTSPGKIGPLPNVFKALSKLDDTAPTKPGNFAVTLSGGKPRLSWTASTDNRAVTGYRITRDNKLLTTTTSLNFTDTSAVAGTSYTYKVQAVDANGNKSKATASLSITSQ